MSQENVEIVRHREARRRPAMPGGPVLRWVTKGGSMGA